MAGENLNLGAQIPGLARGQSVPIYVSLIHRKQAAYQLAAVGSPVLAIVINVLNSFIGVTANNNTHGPARQSRRRTEQHPSWHVRSLRPRPSLPLFEDRPINHGI